MLRYIVSYAIIIGEMTVNNDNQSKEPSGVAAPEGSIVITVIIISFAHIYYGVT